MNIRPVTLKDLNPLMELRKKLWSHLEPEEYIWLSAQINENQDKFQIFIAENENGDFVGFAETSIRTDYVEGCETNRVGYIEGWFVEEEYRLQNIGRKLIEAAENWARGRDCLEMASDCELENDLSLTAHLAIGYEEVARTIHFKKWL